MKNFDIKKIKKTFYKIKNLDIKKTDYLLEYKLIKLLEEISNIPSGEKKLTAIYIPKSINTYWNISCDSHMIPFLAPAITNIVIIDGLPPNNKTSCFGKKNDYGYARYKVYNKKSYLFHLDQKQLCHVAKKEGLKKVIELIEIDLNFEKKIYNCL